MKKNCFFLIILILSCCVLKAQLPVIPDVQLIHVDSGWAANSVNTVIFRKNALVTYKDTQFIAFYNARQQLVIGKRNIHKSHWILQATPYSGNARDAHNAISIMVDGDGFLHISWDHHNNPLHYCRSIRPGSLQLTGPLSMTGKNESSVSYPEFYKLPNGNLMFFYRDGSSGRGNLVLNRYSIVSRKWEQVNSNLIDGEGKRNAYWQCCTDTNGIIYLSWVWRESPDVFSNHDLCFARSDDGGNSWVKSDGTLYQLPITAASAEYVLRIPQGSNLINQTSMCTDLNGNAYIATYFTDSCKKVPQYHILYQKKNQWRVYALNEHTTPFSLSGIGTKKIPISRPQVICLQQQSKEQALLALIFRDEEKGNTITTAIGNPGETGPWVYTNLTGQDLGSWEPVFDTERWKGTRIVDLFVQKESQGDGEGITAMPAQLVQVLEWNPYGKLNSFQPDTLFLKSVNQLFRDAAAQYLFLSRELPRTDVFPKTYEHGQLQTSQSGWWCSGFYPGTLLNLYTQVKNDSLKLEADRMLGVLAKEQFNRTTHDLGFMMYCSFGNAYRQKQLPAYKEILLNSARSLASRFDSRTGCIKSWDSKPEDYLVIIDNIMNLELLFWATKETGDSSFYSIAVTHANTTLKNHFRRDYSSFHVVNYNPITGAVQQKISAQGANDSSAWARGQSWGLYGYTVLYRETHDLQYLQQAENIAGFLLNHPALPADKIPYWDYNAPGIPHTYRDASAAAIMAAALMELCRYTRPEKAIFYYKSGEQILKELSSSRYRAEIGSNGGFILQHSVGHLGQQSEVDVPLTYADYYYTEALDRYQKLVQDIKGIESWN